MSNYVSFKEHSRAGNEVLVRVDAVYIIREQVKMGPSAKVVKGEREPQEEGRYVSLICARGVQVDVDAPLEEVLSKLGGGPARRGDDVPDAKRSEKK